jgi:hypothetical protein
MTDLSKLKKTNTRRSLGVPPSIDEASNNLKAPEIAPRPPLQAEERDIEPVTRRDARMLRRTNRTLPFATRVSPAFDNRLRDIAEREGIKLVELLEKALDAYEKQTGS